MTFDHPWLLILLPVGLWIFGRFVQHQRRSFVWIRDHVGDAFRRRLTVWTQGPSRWHLTLLGVSVVLLALAASGPGTWTEEARVRDGGRLLLAVDASTSMYAQDVPVAGRDEVQSRFAVAKELGIELTSALDGWRVGLASWSGVATVHTPLLDEHAPVLEAVRDLRMHNVYRTSGTSFQSILDLALRFHDEESNGLQVVLLSDGEMPRAEFYDESLAALAEAGVVVHAVGLGGRDSVGLRVFDPMDLAKPVEERGTLKEFETRRVDEHLARIAKATGGVHWLAPDSFSTSTSISTSAMAVGDAVMSEFAERLANRLRDQEVSAGAAVLEGARRRWTRTLLLLVLLVVVLDLHVLARGRGGRPEFRLDRLGRSPRSPKGRAVVASLVLSMCLLASGPTACGQGKLWRAHHANERGLDHDEAERYDEAETSFLRSAAFGVEPETPTYNHARSRAHAEDYARAHELGEQALELAPRLHQAKYNDGIVLYRWGAQEIDPKGCELARTLDLWGNALTRFDGVVASSTDEVLRRKASEQAVAVREQIARLERLVAQPPEHCQSESEDESGGGGGSGGSDDQPPPPPEPPPGEPPLADPPPPADPPSGEPPPPGLDQEPESQPGEAPITLSDAELEEILGALERIQAQAQEEGKFHYRSSEEQSDEESLANPEEIWW